MDGVRGSRALFVACALLIACALLAAVTRPAVDDIAGAGVDTTPTTRSSTTSSSTSTSTSTSSSVVATTDTTTAAPGTSTTEAPLATDAPPVTEAPTTAAPNPVLSSGRCGGRTLPNPTGGTWQCTLSEEFEGTSLNSDIWVAQTTKKSGFHSGAECFVDDPKNIAISDGTLKLTARVEAAPFTCPDKGEPYQTQVTSGMVMTYGKWAQQYGRFEIRAKMPAVKVQGLQTALWMWPVDATRYGPWPASGEIDIAEWYSNRPEYVVPYFHYLGGEALDFDGATNQYCKVGAVEEWHTYTLEWYPGRLTTLYDGTPCLTITPPAHPFHHPFTIALTQALGVGKRNSYVPGATPLPATTEIDYVRAWR